MFREKLLNNIFIIITPVGLFIVSQILIKARYHHLFAVRLRLKRLEQQYKKGLLNKEEFKKKSEIIKMQNKFAKTFDDFKKEKDLSSGIFFMLFIIIFLVVIFF